MSRSTYFVKVGRGGQGKGAPSIVEHQAHRLDDPNDSENSIEITERWRRLGDMEQRSFARLRFLPVHSGDTFCSTR